MSTELTTRRRVIGTISLVSAAGVAAYAVLSAGILGGGSEGAAAPPETRPSPVALQRFDGCEQLRRWYVRTALPLVGPWGLGLPPAVFREGQAGGPVAVSGDGAIPVVGSSGTGTNVQDADVDEADVAKTDGRLVVRVAGRDLVVTDVHGDPHELSRTALPGPPLAHPELLLRGRRVLVVGNEQARWYGGPVEGMRRTFLPVPRQETHARLLSFDIANPSAPRFTGARIVDGGVVSTRQYVDGTVRVVVATGFPSLNFVHPGRERSVAEATRLNKRIVRRAPVTAWLPAISTSSDLTRRPLLNCAEVRHPRASSGLGTVSVLTFPFDESSRYAATAVTGSGDLVYSSAHRLYVATTLGWHTDVHAFAVDGDRTTYAASGSVPGVAKDRWSFSEHDGHLRVVTSTDSGWNPRDNVVTVLDERDGGLRPIGTLGGLGRNEAIESVRWFGALAVVVTFRQTDPVYTVDLSDPHSPRLLGALKVSGYSTYLHPIGDDLLIGVGRDVSASGEDRGAQAATFDLHDVSDVRRADTFPFGKQTDLPVGWDPRTFTYLPAERTLVIPVRSWTDPRSRFVALRVARDGTLTHLGSWMARGYAAEDLRSLPLGGQRVALVGDSVRVVRVG
ncbi:MAG: beta-propeller domain-containing protein [Nocardioidaceae bacterium]